MRARSKQEGRGERPKVALQTLEKKKNVNGFLTLCGYGVNNKTGALQMTATQTDDNHATLALVLFLIGLVALACI